MRVRWQACGALAASALWLAPSAVASPALDAWPAVTPGAGLAVYNHAGNGGSACTAGWLAHTKSGKLVMLLPAHCNYGGDVKMNYSGHGFETIGVFTQPASDKVNGIDVGLVELNNNIPVDLRIADRQPVASTAVKINKGDQLCKYGARTGLRCGVVLNRTASTVEFSAAAEGGDSGGPVFVRRSDGTAVPVGVTVEGDANSTVAVLLQPMLDQLGVTLA